MAYSIPERVTTYRRNHHVRYGVNLEARTTFPAPSNDSDRPQPEVCPRAASRGPKNRLSSKKFETRTQSDALCSPVRQFQGEGVPLGPCRESSRAEVPADGGDRDGRGPEPTPLEFSRRGTEHRRPGDSRVNQSRPQIPAQCDRRNRQPGHSSLPGSGIPGDRAA